MSNESTYTVLARRYRPLTFDEVVGQEHVSASLKGAIAAKRVGHAYLFCGPRGVGKTSMARIMQLPPIDEVPEFLRGRQIVVVSAEFLGSPADGERLLAPLRALEPEIDTFATIPAPALSHGVLRSPGRRRRDVRPRRRRSGRARGRRR